MGIGVLDAKGELVERLQRALPLDPATILDFNSPSPISYGLLVPRFGETLAQLVERRMEVFEDVLGRDNHASLRMARMCRNVLSVAAEHRVPFLLTDYLLSHDDLCRTLGTKSADSRVANYFQNDFARERSSTLPALQSRLEFLVRHRVLSLSFSAETCLDLRGLMEAGKPILINVGGPGMPRALSRVVQSLLASDLRQAVFSRSNTSQPYLWFIDEAQELFKQPSDMANLMALLTMARSYGAHLALLTQSPTAACPSRDFLRQLVTNLRWMLMLRSAAEDARLIAPGLTLSGRQIGRQTDRGQFSFMGPDQERRAIVARISDLPNQRGYLWVRGSSRSAIECRLPRVEIQSHASVQALLQSPSLVSTDFEKHIHRLHGLAAGVSAPARPAGASLDGLSRLA